MHRAALALGVAAAPPGQLRHHALGVHAAGQHVAVVAVGGDDLVALLDRHLHADHHGLLADVEVAEAADQAHAVELRRPLLEAADQQHLAIGEKLLLAAEGGNLLLAVGAGPFAGRSTFVGIGRLEHKTVQETRWQGQLAHRRAAHAASGRLRPAGAWRSVGPRPARSHDDAVAGPGKAQQLDGQLFDDVGIARRRAGARPAPGGRAAASRRSISGSSCLERSISRLRASRPRLPTMA